MVRFKPLLAAGFFPALGVAITQLIQLSFIKSAVANIVIEMLFVGAITYVGVKTVERSVDPQ
ncbi:hypothetical protein [Salarchaeum sp. JOR-1]|uniref:hypothetical protein n=1 Tax=Salarchaeum sp. JOR-1 TaxID=2599399 RepID=UPI0011983849|nr:hypothetical protein [Salarchaeum sp. JOR-1]QDX39442.1 hypothetical protein FQU85_00570 [Salarchaeum sp. JOR-1]